MSPLGFTLSVPTAFACALVFFPFVFLLHRKAFALRSQHPPGPKPFPLIGNLLQIPTINPEEIFRDWFDIYGDVIFLRIFSQPMVVLSTFETAQELLEKRSAIYSDRPRFVLFSELMGWQNASTHMRYGPRFRKHRRFIHQTFNQQASHCLKPIQERETLTLVHGLIQTPENFIQHIRRFAAATILKVTYGADVKSVDDVYVQLAERAGTLTVQSGTPAATLVDFFPFLRHIPTWAPLSGFKRNAEVVKEAVDKMMNVPYEMVKKEMGSGTVSPCLTSRLLERYSRSGAIPVTHEDEQDIKGVAGTMFAAAEDTTICVLSSFVLAMVLHQEVFKKAQEEMDRIIGVDRLPTSEDRDSLPYLESVIKETLRQMESARLMEDDIYSTPNGTYHLPRGSTVIVNIYAILKSCPEPEVFNPNRHTGSVYHVNPIEVVFGFGRRKCPGRHFADAGVWLSIARMVATMHIAKSKDDMGREITPEVAFESGFVRHPKQFTCSMKPRSEKIGRMIEQSFAEMDF
ncbi:cytochrome p450 [Moniliophthora roreri]|nr:cytochrome p450 [Moniliophthora roreri]